MTEPATRYLCVHCDLSFDSSEGDDARCPKCMRKGAVARPNDVAPPDRRPLVVGMVVGIGALAAVGVGYALWARSQPADVGEDVAQGPLEPREFRGHLRRLDLDSPENRALFEGGDDVERLLASDVDDGGWPDRARAIASRFARLRSDRKLVAPDEHGRRRGAFLAPQALARALRGSGPTEAGSLELSLLAVVALREAGVLARVVEIFGFEGQGAPPDRSGTNGYYGVLVRRASGSRDVAILDVAGDGRARPTATRRLDDLDVVAAALTAKAQIALARDRDGSGAIETVDQAIRVDPQAVSARTLRAALLSATGALDDAVAEAESAERLRPDPPRFVMHASLLIARQDFDEAGRLARRALAIAPDYGAAYGILAAVSLARRDMDGARAALESVQSKDPTFDGLALLWANFYLMSGDVERGVARIEDWVRARPSEPMVRLQAAHTLGMVGRRDAAVGHLRAAVGMTEGPDREALEQQIGQAFGATVLAEVLETGDATPPPAADPAAVPPPPGGLQLGSPTLGGRPNRPSLLRPTP